MQGFILFGFGEFVSARIHLEYTISYYKPEQHQAFVSVLGSDAGPSAIAYDAACLWCLGYPEQALARSQEALALACMLDHAFTSADVLCYGSCMLHAMLRDGQATLDHAEELVRKSKRDDEVSGWSEMGNCYRGDALILLGRVQEGIAVTRQGMAERDAIFDRLHRSIHLCFLAEAMIAAGEFQAGLSLLAEALSFVQQTGERVWEAELHRMKGKALIAQGDQVRAEASLHQAIEVARRQQARSWELRAVIDLSRLWQSQGRKAEAYQMLAEIYNWFTEGFETVDL